MSSENLNSEEEGSLSDEMEADDNLGDANASDDVNEDGLDLNMTVEAEGDAEQSPAENKIIFGKNRRNKMFKAKAPAKIRKSVKMKNDNSDEELSNVETSVDEYSSSETEGEIEIPIEMDNEAEKQIVQDVKPETEEHKHPDIQLPEGEPISVVSIKQEYDEDEEMFFREDEMDEMEDEPTEEIKDDAATVQWTKPLRKKKEKPIVTDEDLTKVNVRFSFVCQLCNEKFCDPASLRDHMEKLHGDQIGTYMCATCQRVYQNAEHLRAHMLCHIQLGSYECHECNKIYHHPASLVSHRRRYHKKEGQNHECKECGRTYSILSDLNTHMKTHMPDTYPCKYCEKEFRTDRYLRLHTRHVHFGHKPLMMECKICHKSYQKKSMLTHMKKHQLGKAYKCHYCSKCMTTQYSLMAHIRRHEGVKPYVCQICDKGFVDKGKLSRHINTHSGTRDFQCDICDKTFSERQYLRQHRRIHEESKEYPCRICGTLFKSMNSVWSHMRKHTQSNRYKCNQCGKTCYRPDHLRSHMVSHTGVKDFQCEICSKRFAKSYDLTEHMRGHSGEKPYACSLCDRSFARHGEFRKHKMSKYHREREVEAGLPPSYPPPPPRSSKASAKHQCGSCDKKFSTTSGLAAHLQRKSHVAKVVSRDGEEDTYHDAEGFEEDHNNHEMQSLPALQELPTHRSLNRLNLHPVLTGEGDDPDRLDT